MAMYTAAQIYAFARQAGFSPDQAVTMTAIALAESGGDGTAHATHGEDSRGLWQINMRAHGQWSGLNSYDPVTNARLAYEVSGGGRDISPWTTTHGAGTARYLGFRAAAQQAAASYGDAQARGNWAGTTGYGHPAPAAAVDAGDVYGHSALLGSHDGYAVTTGDVQGSAGHGEIGVTTQRFLEAALAQAGDTYVYGAETDPTDAHPGAFDCSELTQWAAARAGVTIPDGAAAQFDYLSTHGETVSVDQALHTPGALLFAAGKDGAVGHVAISLGDGRTIEARNSRLGVGVFDHGGDFDRAAVLPGLSAPTGAGAPVAGFGPASDAVYGATTGALNSFATGGDGALDQDHDGLSDALEQALGTDPHAIDTDRDGLSDSYEALHTHTSATSADTDLDGVGDAVQLALGLAPGTASTAAVNATADTDHDGLADALERALGTDESRADTDQDGVSDGFEKQLGLNPLDTRDVTALLPPGASGGGPSGLPAQAVEYHDPAADAWVDEAYSDSYPDLGADSGHHHDASGHDGLTHL